MECLQNEIKPWGILRPLFAKHVMEKSLAEVQFLQRQRLFEWIACFFQPCKPQ